MENNAPLDYWQELVEALHQGVMITDDEGTILYVNKFASNLFGLSPAEMIGTNFSYPIATNADQEIEILQKDGSVITAHLKINQGAWKQQFAWVISLSNLTSIKKNEKQLALASVAFNSAFEGIMIVDDQLKVLQVNKAFLTITNLSYQDIIFQSINGFLRSEDGSPSIPEKAWKIIVKKQHWRAEILLYTKDKYTIPLFVSITAIKDEEGDVSHYILFFYDLREIKQQQQKIEQVKTYDFLTGILNTHALVTKLNFLIKHATEDERHLNILSIKVFYNLLSAKSELQIISDKDQLLIDTVQLIDNLTTKKKIFARVSFNEFIVVYFSEKKLTDLVLITKKIINSLTKLSNNKYKEYEIETNIGMVALDKYKPENAEVLLEQAQIARIRSREIGKNNFVFYNATAEEEIQLFNQHIYDLTEAINHDQLTLYYQPKIDIHQAKVIGFEALLRWQHPERGLLAPAQFLLPSFDDHPVSIKLGNWVLAKAIQQVKKMQANQIYLPVSINISSFHLLNEDFKENITNIFSEHPEVPAHLFIFEILETTALENLSAVNQIIDDLKPLGIRFSLDDLGTGYSSISYLKDIKVTEVKIDQSFVRDSINRTNTFIILKELITLCNLLGLDVIAEGVETEVHIRLLSCLGCSRLQGYACAKPMPAKDIIDWTKSWKLHPAVKKIRIIDEDLKKFINYDIEHYIMFTKAINYIPSQHLNTSEYEAGCCFFWKWLREHDYIFKNKTAYQQLECIHKSMHEQLIILIEAAKTTNTSLLKEQFAALEKTRHLFAFHLIASTFE